MCSPAGVAAAALKRCTCGMGIAWWDDAIQALPVQY
jgi:hypothetical protein